MIDRWLETAEFVVLAYRVSHRTACWWLFYRGLLRRGKLADDGGTWR